MPDVHISSSNSIRVIDLGRVSFAYSQSLYHAIASEMEESTMDTILLCSPAEPYLCIGFHQNPQEVLDLNTCNSLGLPIMQRKLGGGTTYLDCNQIFYQCIFHRTRISSIPAKAYEMLLSPPVSALRQVGLNAFLREANEIEVNERRIAGTGGGRIKDACVVVGNILFDFNYDAMQAVIRAPCEEFRQVAGNAMRNRITTLRNEDLSQYEEQIPDLLIEEYGRQLGRDIVYSEPTVKEWKKSNSLNRKLRIRKLQNTLDKKIMNSFKVSASTHIELVRVFGRSESPLAVLRVKHGVIEAAGPVLNWTDLDAICGAELNVLSESEIQEGRLRH